MVYGNNSKISAHELHDKNELFSAFLLCAVGTTRHFLQHSTLIYVSHRNSHGRSITNRGRGVFNSHSFGHKVNGQQYLNEWFSYQMSISVIGREQTLRKTLCPSQVLFVNVKCEIRRSEIVMLAVSDSHRQTCDLSSPCHRGGNGPELRYTILSCK